MKTRSKKSIGDLLHQGKTLVLDGALATELERHGLVLHPRLWSADCLRTAPNLIQTIHEEYIQAGANIITTATYQASVAGFQEDGRSLEEALDLIKMADHLACAARTAAQDEGAEQPLFVAASIGTLGASKADGSEYRGRFNLSRAAIEDYHEPRWQVACDGPSDILALETLPDLLEIEVMMELLDRSQGKQAWVALSCPNGKTLADGTPLKEVIDRIGNRPSILAVGVNCVSPSLVEGLLRTLKSLDKRPLIAYANSGESWDGSQWEGVATSETKTPRHHRWVELGCQIIGGCCRTTPSDIYKLGGSLL